MERNENGAWRTIGAATALYLALAYVAGIGIFLVALRYNEIPDLAGRLAVVVAHPSLVFATNLMMYVLFGPVLVGLALAIRNEAGAARPIADIAAVTGILWAGGLVASGMVANAAIGTAVALYGADAREAEAYWRAIETVTTGLGNGNGEILGSVFTLLVSLAVLRHGFFPRSVAIVGLLACVPGFLSVVPALHDLAGLFGLVQIVWFVLIGRAFRRYR